MKKMLVTLAAAGMLAVPMGTVLAQGNGNGPNGPDKQEQVRERAHEHDGQQAQNQNQQRTQRQLRGQECKSGGAVAAEVPGGEGAGEGTTIAEATTAEAVECAGDQECNQLRNRKQAQNENHDGAGDRGMDRERETTRSGR